MTLSGRDLIPNVLVPASDFISRPLYDSQLEATRRSISSRSDSMKCLTHSVRLSKKPQAPSFDPQVP